MVTLVSLSKSTSLVNHPLLSLLSNCKSMKELKQIHAQITTSGLSGDNFFASKLLLFTAVSDSGDIRYSYQVFLNHPTPTTFMWNTIIRGFSISKTPNRAISLFVQMLRSGASPDYLTFPFLAKSCARLGSFPLAVVVHCHIAKYGLEVDRFVQNSLIHMYASCGHVVSARKLFDAMPEPNLVSWNALIDGYAKCGDLVSARVAFDRMPERDVVSWSALIDGYVKGGHYREALALFEMMQCGGPRANAVTMVSVLCACAHLGALDQGRRTHEYLLENGLRLSLEVSTSLIDMYAKCGSIEEALRVFRAVPVKKTDVLIWNAVIGGLAMHGFCKESLDMFREMRSAGVQPDEITYLGLLSACAHGGLVEDAWSFFRSLPSQGMAPQIEHYACMVDALGRSGSVEEAYEFVRTMPMEPSASLLGALMSACRNHGRVTLGEIVGRRLIELEPNHDGRYIGLSNVYASARRWSEAKTMREAMEKKGVTKAPGFSAIEVDGTLQRFIAHDKTHLHSTKINSMLSFLVTQMKLECNNVQESFLCEMSKEY